MRSCCVGFVGSYSYSHFSLCLYFRACQNFCFYSSRLADVTAPNVLNDVMHVDLAAGCLIDEYCSPQNYLGHWLEYGQWVHYQGVEVDTGLASLKQKDQEVCKGERGARLGLTPCPAEAYPCADILVSLAVGEL